MVGTAWHVLDTNAVSRVLDGDERALGALAAVEPQDVGIPLLVLAELFGVEKSARREENRKRVEVITQPLSRPPNDSFAGRAIRAAVRAAVERRERRTSDFDLVIACTAM